MSEHFDLMVGMKVVCVDDRFNPCVSEWGDQLPLEGRIYTVCKVLPCRDVFTDKGNIGLQFEELQNHGDRLAFSVWRFEPLEKAKGAVIVTDTQAAEDAQIRRIRELEEQNKAQFLEIERLQEAKKKLAYNIEWMAENCRDFQASEQAVSDAADEAEARCAHELQLLEKANRELDAENELLAKERDSLQTKVVELETLCEQQKAAMQSLSETLNDGANGNGWVLA
jgi:hypothetical protein